MQDRGILLNLKDSSFQRNQRGPRELFVESNDIDCIDPQEQFSQTQMTPPSRNPRKRKTNLNRLKRHGHHAIFRALDEPQLFQACHIGVNVGIVALRGLCKDVNAARSGTAEWFQQVEASGGQPGKQRACRFKAQAVVGRSSSTRAGDLLCDGI
jgi:hypothetical protein